MRIPKAVLLASAVLGLLAIAWLIRSGNGYLQHAEFLAAPEQAGWVEIGQFGHHWPARVGGETRSFVSELSFSTADGQQHVYRGFDGYQLRAVFLHDASGRQTVMVLRSAQRQDHGIDVERVERNDTGREADQVEPGVRRD